MAARRVPSSYFMKHSGNLRLLDHYYNCAFGLDASNYYFCLSAALMTL